MLLKIGEKKKPDTVVGRLLDCHERIRKFAAMAIRLSEAEAATHQEIAEAAEAIRRYFEDALPRHVRDEEDSILVRLKGRDAEVDLALEHMHTQHEEHEASIAAVTTSCKSLIDNPGRHSELEATLRKDAHELEAALLVHLEEEERVVLPGIERLLDAETQAAIIEEMQNRRG